ncbi:hypothetical protein HMPREF3232_00614 [Fannyhessea vaginae]|nr:hypothetical protein HMPREF3232_00614 [Fannyhessea vaginae]
MLKSLCHQDPILWSTTSNPGISHNRSPHRKIFTARVQCINVLHVFRLKRALQN